MTCPECHGRGWFLIRCGDDKYDETCPTCRGTGTDPKETPMTINELSHVDDPWTSNHAVVNLDHNTTMQVKLAIITLLAEKPRTADELVEQYRARAEFERWPLLRDLHNVKRRLSHMHTKNKVVAPNGEHRRSTLGRPAIVWHLTCDPDAARVIVAATS